MATTPQLTQNPPPGPIPLAGVGILFGVAIPFFIAVNMRDPSWETFGLFLTPVRKNPLVPLTLLGIQVFIFGLSPLAFERPRKAGSSLPAGHRIKDHLNEASWTSAVILVFITIYCVILIISAFAQPDIALSVGLITVFSVLLSGAVHRLFLQMVDKRSPAERKRLVLIKMKEEEHNRLHRAWLPETAEHDDDQREVSLLSSILTIGGGFTILLTVVSAAIVSPSLAVVLLGLSIGVNSVVLAIAFRWISLALFGRRDRSSDRILWAIPAFAVALFTFGGQIFIIRDFPALATRPGLLVVIILVASAVYSLVFLLLYVDVGRNEIRQRINELTVEVEALSNSLEDNHSSAVATPAAVCDTTGGYPQ